MPFCSALVSGRLRAKSKHISNSFRLPGTKVADTFSVVGPRRGELHVVLVDQFCSHIASLSGRSAASPSQWGWALAMVWVFMGCSSGGVPQPDRVGEGAGLLAHRRHLAGVLGVLEGGVRDAVLREHVRSIGCSSSAGSQNEGAAKITPLGAARLDLPSGIRPSSRVASYLAAVLALRCRKALESSSSGHVGGTRRAASA